MIYALNRTIFEISGYQSALEQSTDEILSNFKRHLKEFEEIRQHSKAVLAGQHTETEKKFIGENAPDLSKIEELRLELMEKEKAVVKNLELLRKPISYEALIEWKRHCLSQKQPSSGCVNCLENLDKLIKGLDKRDDLDKKMTESYNELMSLKDKALTISADAIGNILGRDLRKLFHE